MKWEMSGFFTDKKWVTVLKRYKYVMLVIFVGLLLLLWPQGSQPEEQENAEIGGDVDFDLRELEDRMEKVLSKIDGAGNVSIVLTVKSGVERIYAMDSEYIEDSEQYEENLTTVLISTGDGTEEMGVVKQIYPEFRGALVVCEGGDDPNVRLLITQAVAALTGLRTDKITVCR